jgi:hypothetical protein
MQEYHSKHHASPLIVLKYMRLSYFKDDTSTGFYVVTSLQSKRRFDRLDLILDMVLHEQQGNFKLSMKHDGSGMTLQTTDSTGSILHCLTAWDFRWKDCIKAVLKLQRYVIAQKLQKVGCRMQSQSRHIQRMDYPSLPCTGNPYVLLWHLCVFESKHGRLQEIQNVSWRVSEDECEHQ